MTARDRRRLARELAAALGAVVVLQEDPAFAELHPPAQRAARVAAGLLADVVRLSPELAGELAEEAGTELARDCAALEHGCEVVPFPQPEIVQGHEP